MIITSETARTSTRSAVKLAEEIFGGLLDSHTDAMFLNTSQDSILAVTGLPFTAPAAIRLANDPLLRAITNEQSVLISLNGEIKMHLKDREIPLDDSQKAHIQDVIESVLSASGQINENGEQIIDLKAPHLSTHYTVNLLLGNREGFNDPLQTTPKSVLDRFGRGSFRASQEKQVLATKYELNPDINGETANRQFYLTENGKQIFYSLNVNDNVAEAHCIHRNNSTEIFYRTTCGLEIKRTIFILPQAEGLPTAVEAQRIEITNKSGRRRNIRLVATGMFGITDPGTLTSDIIYANVVTETQLYRLDGKIIALAVNHKPAQCNGEKRFAMIISNGEGMDEYTSDVNGFLGCGTYEYPENLATLSNTPTRRAASFFALAKTLEIDENATAVVDEFVGMSEDPSDVRKDVEVHIRNLFTQYCDPDRLPDALQKTRANFDNYRRFLQVDNDDSRLNSYLSANLPFQVLYQTYISRSFAWTQKSYRETGFREIQDLFASMYYMHGCGKDALIRELLSRWIVNVFEMGYAYHNFTTRGKEPGMCSDDQLWLVQAVYRYVTLTGDKVFLLKEFPMADGGSRTLIDTLKAIIVYSGQISVGKHHLPLLDTADWNDTLRLDKELYNGPQKQQIYREQLEKTGKTFGTALENSQSESVMNAFLLVIAADETEQLAQKAGRKDISELAHRIKKETTDNTRKYAWKNDYFARCLINDGRKYQYLGSSGDGLSLDDKIDGSYYLNSFSWSVLSEVASDEQIISMLKVIDSYLKTPAGLKLCTPVDYDRLDVITGTSFYFPGDRENGGVFKHAAMMAVVACLKHAKKTANEALANKLRETAFFMIDKTLPYKALEDPFVLKGNPRFCTQYNNSETGENIGPILSGTASWLTLALYECCGLQIEGDTITIDPIINRDRFRYSICLNGTTLNVDIDGTANYRRKETSTYCLDGCSSSPFFTLPQDGKVHDLKIIL